MTDGTLRKIAVEKFQQIFIDGITLTSLSIHFGLPHFGIGPELPSKRMLDEYMKNLVF